MSTRFAGSQKLDERRRRRLALESEDAPVARRGAPKKEPATTGNRLTVHPAEIPAPESVATFPLAILVPQAVWKHFAIALAVLLAGVIFLVPGIRLAGTPAEQIPVFELIRLPQSSAIRWYFSLLLIVIAQSGLVVGWIRSQSRKDFRGQYRVWTKLVLGCLISSFCLATNAHHLLTVSLEPWLPRPVPHFDPLAWLIPAAGLVAGLFWFLHAEMRDCRLSLRILELTGVIFTVAVGLQLPWQVLPAGAWTSVAPTGVLLLGYGLLLLATTLHARHVIYYTAEPSQVRRLARVPRPHFGWLSLKMFRRSAPIPEKEATPKPARKPRSAKSQSANSASEQGSSAPPVEPAAKAEPGSRSKPRIRLDAGHQESGGSTPVEGLSQPANAAAEIGRTGNASAENAGPVESEPVNSEPMESESAEPEPDNFPPHQQPSMMASSLGQEVDEDGEYGDEFENDGFGTGKGLSKKQRRKQAREQRERGGRRR